MSSLSSSEFHLPSTAFFGRSFPEYLQFFLLDPGRLAGQRVLDVAAGPSAFTAEARSRGIDAVAVDPLYGYPVDTLATHVRGDYERVLTEMRRTRALFRFRRFASLEEAEASRRGAAARFLADYESGFVQGRYVGAALPRLPFPDGSFELVLCAHLLFVYARHFNFAWHLAALAELARVSRDEVRIHPLSGPDGLSYPELPRLREALEGRGVRSRIEHLDCEFFAGSDTTLVLEIRDGVRAADPRTAAAP